VIKPCRRYSGLSARTMRDFIRGSDVWSKLCEAAIPSFDPTVHLASSCLACFKKGYMQGEDVDRKEDVFGTFLVVNIQHMPTKLAPPAIENPLSR
jgi:hypothetical protein